MNKNNLMYTYFKNLKQGYANDDIDAIEQNARCWVQIAEENPFKYDTPEYEEFFQMKLCYTIWARGDVNAKINRRKMIRHAKVLCALNPKQPYTWDKKGELEDKQEQEQMYQKKEEVKVVNEESQTILGVIPEKNEEKKSFFRRFNFWKKEGEQNDSP